MLRVEDVGVLWNIQKKIFVQNIKHYAFLTFLENMNRGKFLMLNAPNAVRTLN